MSKQHVHPLQLLHLLQTHRGRDPGETDQRAHLLPHPRRIARDVQTSNRPLQRLGPAVIFPVAVDTARDAQDGVFHVAVVLLLHRLGELALPLALGAVLAEDGAGEDFDFRDEVRGVVGVLEHRVDEVLFVAGGELFISSNHLAFAGVRLMRLQKERSGLTCLSRP